MYCRRSRDQKAWHEPVEPRWAVKGDLVHHSYGILLGEYMLWLFSDLKILVSKRLSIHSYFHGTGYDTLIVTAFTCQLFTQKWKALYRWKPSTTGEVHFVCVHLITSIVGTPLICCLNSSALVPLSRESRESVNYSSVEIHVVLHGVDRTKISVSHRLRLEKNIHNLTAICWTCLWNTDLLSNRIRLYLSGADCNIIVHLIVSTLGEFCSERRNLYFLSSFDA